MAKDLDDEIMQAERRLADLDGLRRETAARLQELKRLRATHEAGDTSTELSAASKVSLFGDLFHGREDVFAVRWKNEARGRSGYAPRCTRVEKGCLRQAEGSLWSLPQPGVLRAE